MRGHPTTHEPFDPEKWSLERRERRERGKKRLRILATAILLAGWGASISLSFRAGHHKGLIEGEHTGMRTQMDHDVSAITPYLERAARRQFEHDQAQCQAIVSALSRGEIDAQIGPVPQ